MTARLLRWLLLASVLWLSACSTPSLRPHATSTDITAFWSGRLALQVDSTPPQNLSASFELLGSAQQGELLLLSPLGNTLGRLRWQPGQAQLEQGDQHWQDRSVQALTEQLTGTTLPLEALFSWLKGQDHDAPGWQFDLSQFESHHRIRAERLKPEPRTLLKLQLDR
ncbi:MAG: Outer-rane lipoprotein LolB [Pseudomonadota bacterium]|jgi:outer membrane lipoprotein LolB